MRKMSFAEFDKEIKEMCAELMAERTVISQGGFRQDRYENDYCRREGITMPITFDREMLAYD